MRPPAADPKTARDETQILRSAQNDVVARYMGHNMVGRYRRRLVYQNLT